MLKKEFEKKVVALLQQKRDLQSELDRVKAESLEERMDLNDRLIKLVQQKTQVDTEVMRLRVLIVDKEKLETREGDVTQKEIELGFLEAELLRREKALSRQE